MLKIAAPPQKVSTSPLDVPEIRNPSLVLEGFLRREELAKQLGRSPRTLDRWDALRIGPPRVHLGRTILYCVASVRDWLRSRAQQSTDSRKFPIDASLGE